MPRTRQGKVTELRESSLGVFFSSPLRLHPIGRIPEGRRVMTHGHVCPCLTGLSPSHRALLNGQSFGRVSDPIHVLRRHIGRPFKQLTATSWNVDVYATSLQCNEMAQGKPNTDSDPPSGQASRRVQPKKQNRVSRELKTMKEVVQASC